MNRAALTVALLVVLGVVQAMAARIPEEVKEVVAFVYIKKADQLIPNGTGFFVGVPHPTKADTSFIYFVTARHVISEKPFGPLLSSIVLRLEKRDGGVQNIEIPLEAAGPKRNVFLHREATVDLAVLPLAPNQELIKYKFLPVDLITSKEKFKDLGIGEGSEVFFTGLFTPHIGQLKNYPVVRFGRVALITDEKVEFDGRAMELYLIESSSFGGNSGSPVFFYLGSDRIPGSLIVGAPELHLAGVMMGAFQDVRPIQIAHTAGVPVSTANLGIAAVIPAYKLLEVLHSDEVVSLRSRE